MDRGRAGNLAKEPFITSFSHASRHSTAAAASTHLSVPKRQNATKRCVKSESNHRHISRRNTCRLRGSLVIQVAHVAEGSIATGTLRLGRDYGKAP